MTDTKPGFAGFICPKGFGDVPQSFCLSECKNPCHPLPVVAGMGGREVIPGLYSVTEILKPYQAIYLARHNPYWVTPDSQVFMLNGSVVHYAVENGGEKLDPALHLIEQRWEREIGGVKIRGTYDYYDVARKTLWDVKTAKAYTTKKLKGASKGHWQDEDYFVQLNIYRALFVPEAEALKLWVLVQGWTRQEKDVSPVEQISVPMAPVDEVKAFIEGRAKVILENEADPSTIKPCLPKDRWVNERTGKPLRCLEYCAVNKVCPQHQAWIKELK